MDNYYKTWEKRFGGRVNETGDIIIGEVVVAETVDEILDETGAIIINETVDEMLNERGKRRRNSEWNSG